MLNNEQEFFFKDFFIILSALAGLIILIVIQLNNLGFRFRPLGRRITDLKSYPYTQNSEKKEFIFNKDWHYSVHNFTILAEDYHLIWHIGIFEIVKIIPKINLKNIDGFQWHEFSNSKTKTENIMVPIFRKIIGKYKKQFDFEKSIQFLREENTDQYLYSWLKNESHLHTAIYNFLDECIFISNELNIKPTLIISLSDYITFEILLPKNELILVFEKEIRELYAVDLVVEKEYVKIILWVAFSQNNVPETCIKDYSKSNIFTEWKKSS